MLINRLKKFLTVVLSLLSTIILVCYGIAGASPSSDLQSILDGTSYYNPSATSCGAYGTVPIPTISANAASSGTWTGGPKTGPYYLEEFAIQVLQDVAKKTNTPVGNVLTQEHVIALIGWFYREGGDIADGPPQNNNYPNLFNPLNTSINDPTIENTNAPGGVESFLSFNDGVEGTARTIVGSYQNRIAAILTQQYSTAEQVAETIANFQNYPGNLAWASPGGNPTQAEVIADNQNVYLPSLLTQIEQARTNYINEATLELGTPQAESFIPSDHVAASLLEYQPTASSSTGISTNIGNQPDTSASASGCATNVSCNNSAPTSASSSQLTQVRQNIVCIATNELQEHWTPISSTTKYSYYLTYTQGATEEWCADFASWVYNQAGAPFGVNGNWREPSVAGIVSLAQQSQGFQWHPQSSGYIPVPGDLAIYYDSSSSAPYYHVTVVVAVNGGSVITIGGDQTNPLYPNNTNYGNSNSNSVVSISGNQSEYSSGGIAGYVSPD